MSGFRWYNRCPVCSTKVRAETTLVLDQKLAEHLEKCVAAHKAKSEKAAAASAQGDLFGGGA